MCRPQHQDYIVNMSQLIYHIELEKHISCYTCIDFSIGYNDLLNHMQHMYVIVGLPSEIVGRLSGNQFLWVCAFCMRQPYVKEVGVDKQGEPVWPTLGEGYFASVGNHRPFRFYIFCV